MNFDVLFKDAHVRQLLRDNRQWLARGFSRLEVVEGVKSMHPSKSPSIDGMHASFYQTYWEEIGEYVTNLVLRYLNGELSFDKLNETCIVLIPKKKVFESMVDFRLINLCNVIYNIISKILVSKMKHILNSLIDISHNAFACDRLITHNIIVATKAFIG